MKTNFFHSLRKTFAFFFAFTLLMTLLPANVAFAAAETISCGTTGNRTISVGTYNSGATDGGSIFSSGADLTLNTGGGSDCTFTISQDQAASAISLNSLTIGSGVTLTQDATGTTADTYSQLKLSVTGALSVEAGGAIDVSGKGYCGGDTTCNSGYVGYTGGNTQTGGSTENFAGGSGGSHGGRGAEGYSANASTVYDSVSNPVLPGGGGPGAEWYYSPGANGGGVVVVTAGSMVVEGSILAEDNMSFSTYAGGGGGTINLTVNGAITGSGTLSVAAKDSIFTEELGGGGRMAIKNYSSLSGTLTLKVNGGNGSTYYDGSSGTLYLQPSGQTYGDLYLDNGSSDSFYHNTILPYPVPASDQNLQFSEGYVFNSINVANYGVLSVSNTLDDVQNGSNNLDRKLYSLTCEASDDDASNGEIVYNSSSSSYYPGISDAAYDYTCADPVYLVGLQSTSQSKAESIASSSFTIVASGVADGDVTVDYAVSVSSTATGTNDYILADGTATIVSGTSSDEITFSIVDDTDRESSETLIVTLSNATGGTLTTDTTFTYTITDNDTPVVNITESGGTTAASEGGVGDTYTIVLGTQPTANVDVAITGDADVSVDDSSLTFTTADWDTPQTITATPVNDGLAEDSHSGTITHAATSTDVDYQGIPIADVTISISDNDYAGITTTESSYSTSVREGGATDSFTMVLNTQPSDDVTITPSPGADCTVSPSSITLTTSNWATPQTFTVTAVDDTEPESSEMCYIEFPSPNAIVTNDTVYDGQYIMNVTATVLDNDTAGVTVNTTSANAYEGGANASYTVVLDSVPTADVTIAVSSDGPGELTLSPSSLVFTTANWSTPQTVTGTAINDTDAEAQAYLTATHTATSSDTRYAGISISSPTIYVNDNDMILVTESASSTDVTEGGATDTYDVVLGMDPASDTVVITIYTYDSETSTSPTELTFTTSNWNVPQTVTVTATDDTDNECAHTGTITYSVWGGYGSFYGVTIADTTLNITDNDGSCSVAGVTITESSSSTDVTEGGATDTYTVVLDTLPTAGVTVALTGNSDLSFDDASLDFTAVNWATPQTVTVTAVNDDIDEDAETPSITHAATSTDSDYNGVSIASVTANITDNDTAGFTATTISGNTTEAGGSVTFNVTLNTQPTANVTIPVSSSDTGEGTVSPSSLTFTAENWSTPQTVTVTGANDDLDDGNIGYTILLGAATSSDGKYDTLDPSDVSATNMDNDAVGFTIVESGGTTAMTEGGATDSFTVVLDSQPTTDVVLDVSSNDTSSATVGSAQLTFTNGNWNVAQTITITAPQDGDPTSETPTITVSVNDLGSDNTFDTLADQTVNVAITDNDTAGITVSTISVPTTEAGGTATYTVVLTAQPTGNVVIDSATDDDTEGTVTTGAALTFTTSNWDTPQTVTVTGASDDLDDGNVAYSIAVTVDVDNTADTTYDSVTSANVSATNTDTDTSSFTINPVSVTTAEAGGTATFTVKLTVQPTADVSIGISSSDIAEGTVSPSSLTFTSENWNTNQTVTVTGVDDDTDGADDTYNVVLAAATSEDSNYSGVDPTDVVVTSTDDDTAGITVGAISGNTAEAGDSATYTVVLDTQPTADVVISVVSSDSTEGTVSAGTLTFTSENWNAPQTVTITGVNDTDDDDNVAYTVAMDTVTSDDSNYSGFTLTAITLSNTDDDTAAPAAAASGSSFFTTISRSIQNAAANNSDAAETPAAESRAAELQTELGVDEVVTDSFESDGKTDKLIAVLNEEEKTEFVIEEDTEITTEDGEPFTGNLEIPTLVAERDVTAETADFNPERAFVNAIFVDTGEEHVYFDKPVVVTLPLSDSSLTANRLEVWTFNEKFGTWQKLETQVIVDYKNRTISFEVNRFSYVAVLENQVFEDTAKHWANHYILVLTKEGILKGVGGGKFEPDRSITRAEMTKVIMLAFGYEVEETTDSKFSDIQRVHWGYDYVNTAAEKGIIKGYADGTFKPDAPVTRVEALKMVLKAARKDTSDVGTLFRLIYPDVDAQAWYIGYLKFAAYRDLVDQVADQSFMPNAPITRAEVAKIVIKTRDLE